MLSNSHHVVAIGYPLDLVDHSKNPLPPPPPPESFPTSFELIPLIVCILSVVALIIIISIFLLVSSTRDEFHQPEFQVLDAAAANATGGWNLTLLITNPNAARNISYLHLNADLWYRSHREHVASTCMSLLSLFQDAKQETRVRVEFASVSSADVAGEEGDFGVTVLVTFVYKDGHVSQVGMRTVDCFPITMSRLGFGTHASTTTSFCNPSQPSN